MRGDSLSNHRRAPCSKPLPLQILPAREWRSVCRMGCRSSRGLQRCFGPPKQLSLVARCYANVLWNMRNAVDLPAGRQLDTIDVTTATLDRPEQFPPTREIWIEHKVPWATLNPDLRHYPRTSGE